MIMLMRAKIDKKEKYKMLMMEKKKKVSKKK
jgi:hypothetical protein